MKKKKIIIATVSLAVFSVLLFSGCKHHHSKGAFVMDYFTEVLDLTEDQEKQLQGIREELIAEAELLRKDREQMHDTLKKQISGEVMDREVMRQLVTDHRKAMKPLIDLAIDRIAEFHAGLTPEQRDKLLAKLEKFEKHHQCFKE